VEGRWRKGGGRMEEAEIFFFPAFVANFFQIFVTDFYPYWDLVSVLFP
jgi:hypothetical protein